MAIKSIQTVTLNGSIVPIVVETSALQPLTGTQVVNNFLKKLTPLHTENASAVQRVATYTHGITAASDAYQGGVYSPTQNRIYLVPFAQANQINWHYIDCATGSVVSYTHGVTAASGAYLGGVYSPTQNRIYLVPYVQSNQTKWHFIASTAQASLAPHYFGSTILSSTL